MHRHRDYQAHLVGLQFFHVHSFFRNLLTLVDLAQGQRQNVRHGRDSTTETNKRYLSILMNYEILF